ncbi:MAG: CCA tRNA nucleotidyltransferase [Rhizobium sp.]|nr:CCA tRNA nucleotidyltransferase [Rhizobium sp.]
MTSVADHDWFRAPGLTRVLDLLNQDGEARVVGGAVRNSLMGLPVSDMDIATTLLPEAVQARAEAAGIKCVPTGIKHGTVTLVVDGRPFEVTTLRHDVETDGRHAQVAFTDDWQADAARRDLTINALYADREGLVHDYVGGVEDIGKANIRFIGNAAERIAEDYLRILRFFRFFAHYGRGRPDAEGIRASAQAKDRIRDLSAERIWAEMKKLLSATDPFRALLWMRTAGVLTVVLPETEKWGIDSTPDLVAAEARFGWVPDPLLRLSAIIPVDVERIEAMASRLRLSTAERAALVDYASCPAIGDEMSGAQLNHLLYRHGTDGAVGRLKMALAKASAGDADDAASLAKIGRLSTLLDHAQSWMRPTMPVRGADLVAAGIPAGPRVGEALATLESAWLSSNFKLTKDELMATLSR